MKKRSQQFQPRNPQPSRFHKHMEAWILRKGTGWVCTLQSCSLCLQAKSMQFEGLGLFSRKARVVTQPCLRRTGGDSVAFSSIFTDLFFCSQAESQPAPPPLRKPLGNWRKSKIVVVGCAVYSMPSHRTRAGTCLTEKGDRND